MEDKLARVNITVPEHILEEFKALAKLQRRSFSAQVTLLMESWIALAGDALDEEIARMRKAEADFVPFDQLWSEIEQEQD